MVSSKNIFRVLTKRVKTMSNNKWSHVIHGTQSAKISQKQDGHNIYVIMKTMYTLGYHQRSTVAIHMLRYMMYAMNTELLRCT